MDRERVGEDLSSGKPPVDEVGKRGRIPSFLRGMMARRDLTEGSLARNIWVLAFPMMFSNLFQTAFEVVDTIFVGRLGPAALAGVSMSGTIIHVVMTAVIGISIGTTAMVARFVGAKDRNQADSAAMQSLILGISLAAILAFIGFVFSERFLTLLGAEPQALMMGTSYVRVLFAGILTVFLFFQVSAILQGAGDAVTPMLVMMASTVLNIALDPLLIFGIGFFPRLGVAGAAYATVLSRGMGGLALLYVLVKGRSRVHVRLDRLRPDFGMMGRLVKIAVPGSIQMGLQSVSGLILMGIVAAFGTAAVAAYGIGGRVNMIVMMPGFGLAGATATLVGQNLGAGKPDRAEKSAWLAAGFYMMILLFLGSLFFSFPSGVVKVFNSNPDVVRMGSSYIRIAAASYVFLALAIVLSRALNGAGDTLTPMIITGVTLYGVQIPLAFILPKAWSLDTTGLWLALAISIVVQASTTATWFKLGIWKRKRV